MQLTANKLKCPYCAARIEMLIDESSPDQQYIEDCEVCCNPIQVSYSSDGNIITSFSADSIEQ